MGKPRLIGVDLFRAIAAFAVVIIHAGGEVMASDTVRSDFGLMALMQFCRFAVPFFLAASFYLMIGKLLRDPLAFSGPQFLSSRVTRLLIPYALWSIFYLGIRAVKALQAPHGLAQLFQDPIFLIFFGGSAIHLYFLPLLFTGSLLLLLIKPLAQHLRSLRLSVILLLLSTGLYEAMFITGNYFNLGDNCLEQPQSCAIAFQPLLQHWSLLEHPIARLLSVEFAWVVRGFVYIFASAVLLHPKVQGWIGRLRSPLIPIGIFLLATLAGEVESFKVFYVPLSLYELGVSYGLLIGGIVLSKLLQAQTWIQNLGNASFGIYLIHYLMVVFGAAVLFKLPGTVLALFPATILAVILATVCFLLSWAIMVLLAKQPIIGRLLFSS